MKPTPGDYLTPALYAFGLIIAGIVLRYIRVLRPITKPAFRLVNVGILWVMLPTVVFVSIARYDLDQILGFSNAAVFAFVGLGVCFVLAVGLSTLMRHDRKTTIAVTLNSAFMNVTYLGLPMVYAMVGIPGLGPASLYAVSIGIPHLVLGVALASSASKRHVNLRFVLENVLIFPATIALITALLFIGFQAHLWDVVQDTFDVHLAKPFFALMLLFVGYQMPLVNPRKYVSKLATVGAIRFLVCPLVVFALIGMAGLSIATDISPKPSLIQAMMPPAVFNVFLAYNFKLDLKLYGAMVFYLTLFSLFVALPLMIYLVF
ncbi:MAG: AEC family transporter [Candidatus Hadarchaeaceae archaeon]